MTFVWSYKEAQRLAAFVDRLEAERKHNKAVEALHALSDAFGVIADHAVFASLHSVDSWATVRLGDHLDNREAVLVRITNGSERDYELWMPGGRIAHVDAIDARPTALRAIRAAVDARLAGADWVEVIEAAQRAVNGGEQ